MIRKVADLLRSPSRIPDRIRRSLIDRTSQDTVRRGVQVAGLRTAINWFYNTLSESQRSSFHENFSKAFREGTYHVGRGRWKVFFSGRKVLMPLSSERLWLDWDHAVSIVGHDIEVKQTYEALLHSPEGPELFVDIGANYGTHSLLFLVHGIESISFEPNSSCHGCFRELCELNGVRPRLEPVALGAEQGTIKISYPEKETWLGSTDSAVIAQCANTHEMITETVQQRVLDDYVSELQGKRTLIKIDTEGNELGVLRGGVKVLETVRPWIVFECWQGSGRADVFALLASLGYEIYDLPWNPAVKGVGMGIEEFRLSSAANFVAAPSNKLRAV